MTLSPSAEPGLVIGKFLPPHAGHLHLFDFARRWTRDLTIVVEHMEGEAIPSALRTRWVQELAPDARVVHLERAMPQAPEEHPDFWGLWRRELLRLCARPPQVLFASETYGPPLASTLGARFIPVDLERAAVPISATAIRANPAACWSTLPAPVRAWFARRIAVVGPESTGKSTLSRALARELGATWVPEHARALLEEPGAQDRGWPALLEDIARGQQAQEEALARQCAGLLVCDTDLLTTTLWSEELTGSCPPWLRAAAAAQAYELTLLCDVDLPWVADPVRYRPRRREDFLARFVDALQRAGRRTVLIQGSGPARLEAALAAVADVSV